MQETVANGDWAAIQGGIVSTKAGMQSWYGYGGYARSPLPRPTSDETAKWKEGFRDLVILEKVSSCFSVLHYHYPNCPLYIVDGQGVHTQLISLRWRLG